jgi:hypothetical protein
VTKYIEDVFGPNQCHIQICIDWETIKKLGLELKIAGIRRAIVNSKKLKLKNGVRLLISRVNADL